MEVADIWSQCWPIFLPFSLSPSWLDFFLIFFFFNDSKYAAWTALDKRNGSRGRRCCSVSLLHNLPLDIRYRPCSSPHPRSPPSTWILSLLPRNLVKRDIGRATCISWICDVNLIRSNRYHRITTCVKPLFLRYLFSSSGICLGWTSFRKFSSIVEHVEATSPLNVLQVLYSKKKHAQAFREEDCRIAFHTIRSSSALARLVLAAARGTKNKSRYELRGTCCQETRNTCVYFFRRVPPKIWIELVWFSLCKLNVFVEEKEGG